MTQPQATAEVFWTAFQAMKPAEREAFIGKLMRDKNFAESLQHVPMSSNAAKLELMRDAMSDPLFVADLEEISEDFRYADLDGVIG